MSILIDDAGWGCLVGGVLIGACRVEREEFFWKEIPVEQFQEPKFSQGTYLEIGAQLAAELLRKLSAPADEPITVCMGYVLQGIREWLATSEYTQWESGKVGEPLQGLIEHALQDYLCELGLEIDYETLTQKQGLAFYKAVEWLHGGNPRTHPRALPHREECGKTGWSTFRLWADHPYDEGKQLAAEQRRQRNQERRMESVGW